MMVSTFQAIWHRRVRWIIDWKGIQRKQWSNLTHYPDICLEGLRKIMKLLSPGRDLNPLLPKHLNQKLCHFSQLDYIRLLSKQLLKWIALKLMHYDSKKEVIFRSHRRLPVVYCRWAGMYTAWVLFRWRDKSWQTTNPTSAIIPSVASTLHFQVILLVNMA
jgi:hypothetical protein